jgi:hypothetical protein
VIGVLQQQRNEQAIEELLEAERRLDTARDLSGVHDRDRGRELAKLGYRLSRLRRQLELEVGR